MKTLRSVARRLVIGLGIASILVTAVPAAASAAPLTGAASAHVVAAAAAAPPAGFVKHTSRFWTWFGPRNWIASYSTYGITVSAPGDVATWDYGASSTLCRSAPTWPRSAYLYFVSRRAGIAAGSGATVFKWLSIGAITALGPRSFRQVNLFDARINGGIIRGKITLIYSDNGGGYCYQSSDARVSVKTRYSSLIGTLDAIAKYTYYLAPGVCDPTVFSTRC